MRYWFLVYGDPNHSTKFGGACFVAVSASERTVAGVVAQASRLIPPDAHCLGVPCPRNFTPPAAYVGKVLSEIEWQAFWQLCTPPVTS